MRTETRAASAIFAANRAQGAVRFDVRCEDGVTRRGTLHESGSLRVRFPSPEDEGLSAVLVNTAIATATDPVRMARAFALATEAGRLAALAGRAQPLASIQADASSPLTGFLGALQ